jgi:hypothetical protein
VPGGGREAAAMNPSINGITDIVNNSGVLTREVFKLKKYGTFTNHWRQRVVTVYAHPTDQGCVVSYGVSFDQTKITICKELLADYAGRIQHNDWSPYY